MAYADSYVMSTPSLPCPSLPPAAYAHQFHEAGASNGHAWGSAAAAAVMPLGSMVVTADGFASSILAQPPAPRIPENEKEPSYTKPSCGSSMWRDESKSANGSAQTEADRQAAQYRDMKLRYMRTLAAGSRRGSATAFGATPLMSSSMAMSTPRDVSSKPASLTSAELEQREQCEKSHNDSSSANVSPTSSGSRPSLLSKLLSSRPPLSRPASPGSSAAPVPAASTSPSVSPSMSRSNSSSSMASMPALVRRSSPIPIPTGRPASSGGDDGGVRYRRAARPTRDEKQQQVRELRSASPSPSSSPLASASAARDFTFTDVFAQPPPLAASVMRAPAALPLRSQLLDSFLSQ